MNILTIFYVLPYLVAAHAFLTKSQDLESKATAEKQKSPFTTYVCFVIGAAYLIAATLMAFYALFGGYFMFATATAAAWHLASTCVVAILAALYAKNFEAVNGFVEDRVNDGKSLINKGFAGVKSLFKKKEKSEETLTYTKTPPQPKPQPAQSEAKASNPSATIDTLSGSMMAQPA